jgi:hypothetical protein
MEMTMQTKTLAQLNEELDAFNATLNDENEDTPELLAEHCAGPGTDLKGGR